MIGTKIGHYFLVRQIGEGGTGAVYLARHHSLGTRKAVKVLLPKYSQVSSLIWRLQNEAMAIARLHHRNIVGVDDFGQLPDGQWYIMMPFLEGVSLESVMVRSGRLPIHQTLHILAQICAALDAAHAAGIIHRDLKPANVFLTRCEDDPWRVTLLDFGLAKIIGADASEHSTDKGANFGTPVFMAAELFEDASSADLRADIFALGVMAYKMVTAQYPFGSHPGPVLYRKQVHERPARPAGVPAVWAEVILAALSRRREDRPASARAFAIALAAATPAEPPKYPNGADILATVARELVVPGSGPVVAATAAATALSEQIRAPLWPPVPTAPSIAQPLRRSPDQSTLVPAPVAISNGVAVITATASTLRARPYVRLAVLWDLVLRPARSRRRLALWVVLAVVTAATIAILYRDAHSASPRVGALGLTARDGAAVDCRQRPRDLTRGPKVTLEVTLGSTFD